MLVENLARAIKEEDVLPGEGIVMTVRILIALLISILTCHPARSPSSAPRLAAT